MIFVPLRVDLSSFWGKIASGDPAQTSVFASGRCSISGMWSCGKAATTLPVV